LRECAFVAQDEANPAAVKGVLDLNQEGDQAQRIERAWLPEQLRGFRHVETLALHTPSVAGVERVEHDLENLASVQGLLRKALAVSSINDSRPFGMVDDSSRATEIANGCPHTVSYFSWELGAVG
jgi:hypothetical protein